MVLSGRIICSKPGIYADGVQFCIFVFKKIQYIMKHLVAILFMLAAMPSLLFSQDFKLGESGYFNCKGVDAMLFNDYYPEGHQGGVSIIMHGKRDVSAAAGLTAVSRVLKGHNDTLSYHCLEMQTSQTPYGVPYKPDIFSPEPVINAMNFVLGGGSSHYMFLILASRKLLQQRNN